MNRINALSLSSYEKTQVKTLIERGMVDVDIMGCFSSDEVENSLRRIIQKKFGSKAVSGEQNYMKGKASVVPVAQPYVYVFSPKDKSFSVASPVSDLTGIRKRSKAVHDI